MQPTNETTRPQLSPSWSLVSKNFDLLKQHLEQVVVIVLLPTLAITLGDLIMQSSSGLGFVVFLIGIIWYFYNIAPSYYLQLSAAKGKSLSTSELYNKSSMYRWRLIGFTILFGVITLIGLILLIIPGLIILRRYILSGYYIVDKNLSIGQAMKLSAAQTKPISGYIWGTIGVIIVLGIAGSIISLIFTFIPGFPSVISALTLVSYIFVLALRYVEIPKNTKLAS